MPSVGCAHPYTSARPYPANSIPSLASKNSLICDWVRLLAFRIPICIPQRLAYPDPPIFRVILYWNQVPFHHHLVLDNSQSSAAPHPC
jgi:hypothetical protein